MKVERISTLYKCPHCSRYTSELDFARTGCLQVSLTPKFVQRRRVVEVCSKYVDARSTSTAGVDAGCTRPTAVCFAWSHDLYRYCNALHRTMDAFPHPVEHDVSLSDAARHLALYSLRYGLGGM